MIPKLYFLLELVELAFNIYTENYREIRHHLHSRLIRLEFILIFF